MTTSLSVAELAHLVTAVPGVRAIEPGIGSTLRALGSRMRQQDPQQARFGVIVEEGSSRAVIEIGIDGSRPVKDIVRDVQEAFTLCALVILGQNYEAVFKGQLVEVLSSDIGRPVFGAIWLGHRLVTGSRMVRLEEADVSGAVVRERS